MNTYKKVKQSCYRPEQPQRMDRGIAPPFRDLGAWKGGGGVVSNIPQPFTPGTNQYPLYRRLGGPQAMCAKNLAPTRIQSPDRTAGSQLLYQLSYPSPMNTYTKDNFSITSAHDRPKNLLSLSVYYGSELCYVQPWGPPSLLYDGYQVFPWGRKWPGRDADPTPPSSAEV
jgi:hypothetical protein